MISIIAFEHFVLFYYNTKPPPEQVFLLFIYKILLSIYAQFHNSSHYLKKATEKVLFAYKSTQNKAYYSTLRHYI